MSNLPTYQSLGFTTNMSQWWTVFPHSQLLSGSIRPLISLLCAGLAYSPPWCWRRTAGQRAKLPPDPQRTRWWRSGCRCHVTRKPPALIGLRRWCGNSGRCLEIDKNFNWKQQQDVGELGLVFDPCDQHLHNLFMSLCLDEFLSYLALCLDPDVKTPSSGFLLIPIRRWTTWLDKDKNRLCSLTWETAWLTPPPPPHLSNFFWDSPKMKSISTTMSVTMVVRAAATASSYGVKLTL